jgi:F0F1-type ATP synthase membrane subunit c/vacuolar-type H+-ATPase subunit K
MVLILIFAEVLGLYGCVSMMLYATNFSKLQVFYRLIVALIMNTKAIGADVC